MNARSQGKVFVGTDPPVRVMTVDEAIEALGLPGRPKPKELSFLIPGPPIPWQRAGVAADGHHYTQARTKAYQKHCATMALQARQKLKGPWPMRAAYDVTLVVHRRRDDGDIDNFQKTYFDGFQGVLWGNDKKIVHSDTRLWVRPAAPCCEVVVRALED